MFKGFGKHKYTADERQMQAVTNLAGQLREDKFMQSKVNAGTNQIYLIMPESDDFMVTSEYKYTFGEGTIRWDLLNPGCPDLVGIRMFTKPFKDLGKTRTLEGSRNSFTAIYDRSKKIMTAALQLDSVSEGHSACISFDLTAEDRMDDELIDTPERHKTSLERFTDWSAYDFALSLIPKDDVERINAMTEKVRELLGDSWDDVYVKV
tara:strand:- start:1784 stop:2404 length:621 start_codon:yes stop_codon:yes gene_type:complete